MQKGSNFTACEVKTQRRNKDVKCAIKKFLVAAAQRSQPVISQSRPVPVPVPVPESSAWKLGNRGKFYPVSHHLRALLSKLVAS